MPRATNLVQRYRLITLIIGAIIVSLLLTAFSVMVYVRDGTSQLDLSRPGYEEARSQVRPDDKSPAFKPEGALTAKVMEEFTKELKKKINEFNQLSSFDVAPLEDQRLKLDLEL